MERRGWKWQNHWVQWLYRDLLSGYFLKPNFILYKPGPEFCSFITSVHQESCSYCDWTGLSLWFLLLLWKTTKQMHEIWMNNNSWLLRLLTCEFAFMIIFLSNWSIIPGSDYTNPGWLLNDLVDPQCNINEEQQCSIWDAPRHPSQKSSMLEFFVFSILGWHLWFRGIGLVG